MTRRLANFRLVEGFIDRRISLLSEVMPEGAKSSFFIQFNTKDLEVVAPDDEVVAPVGEVVVSDSKVMTPRSEVIIPDSKVGTPGSKVVIPDSKVITPDGEVVPSDSEVVLSGSEVVPPDSAGEALDSEDAISGNENVVVESKKMSRDSKAIRFGRWMKLLVMFFLVSSFTSPPEVEEYSIKAAFLYKFTNYIEWPSHLPGTQFVIGIIGPSPITGALGTIAATKTVKEKKIVIRQYENPEEIGSCHILFISRKASQPLEEILAYADGRGTLIVSEKAGYAALGTEINFILVDNKLKFEANTKAINEAGLTASSQLLKLAIIVN